MEVGGIEQRCMRNLRWLRVRVIFLLCRVGNIILYAALADYSSCLE